MSSFWTFGFFHIFGPKIAFFWQQNFWKLFSICASRRGLFWPSLFLADFRDALKFQIFKFKLLITYDLMAVDNLWGQIWNQRILLVNILENEENRGTNLITVHPAIPLINTITVSQCKKGLSSRVFLRSHFRQWVKQ